MKYNICVAFPIKSGDLKEIDPIIKNIINENPEFIEFRFDYIEDLQKITPLFLKDLLNLIKSEIRSIFTFRDFSEGGQIDLIQSERLKIIKLLIEAQPHYIDIEMSTDKDTLKEIVKFASENNVKLIFSYHNFKKTPTFEEGLSVVKEFKDALLDYYIVDFMAIKNVIYKIIFTAQAFEDNLIPLKICNSLFEKDKIKSVISFCMGELGIFSRMMCVKAGSFLTYASLGERTAPGQINIRIMREFLQILFKNY